MNEYYNYEDCSRIQGQCLDFATIILFQWHPDESVAFKSLVLPVYVWIYKLLVIILKIKNIC